jgi:cystathionine beta-lyase/cystathionine gamma-synthase
LIVAADLYGGTTRLIERLIAPLGVQVERVDTTNLTALEQVLVRDQQARTWVLLETPSNPLLRVSDIVAIAEMAHVSKRNWP